jgi:hypothetical protein
MPLTPGLIYPGTTLRINGYIDDLDSDPVDPSLSVAFKLRNPNGEITTYVYGTDSEIQKSETGVYMADVAFPDPGRWFYQWVATDEAAGTVVDQGDVLVQDSPLYIGGGEFYQARR